MLVGIDPAFQSEFDETPYSDEVTFDRCGLSKTLNLALDLGMIDLVMCPISSPAVPVWPKNLYYTNLPRLALRQTPLLVGI